MAAKEFPVSFKDPLYAELDARTEQKLGLPSGLLASIRLNGERTNADKVSDAGARTPYQVIPETRAAVIKKYGIDPLLSPENASEVAGLLLKESLQRNKGDVTAAVGEYIGGTDRKNWGKVTNAYIQRVTGAMSAPKSEQGGIQKMQLERIAEAYKAGRMDDAAAREFERDFPQYAKKDAAPVVPAGVLEAYNSGRMSSDEKAEFEADVRSGAVKLPSGMQLNAGRAMVAVPGMENTVPPAEEAGPSMLDRIIGTGEAALTAGTGIVGGTLGLIGGGLGAGAAAMMNGDFGTKQAADAIEQAAATGAQKLTYAPRTEQGRSQVGAVGRAMQQVLPILPVAGALGPAGALSTAAGAVRTGAAATLDKAGAAMARPRQSAIQAQSPVAAPAGVPVTPAAAVPAMPAAELARTAKNAADGGLGSGKARAVLAKEAAPSPEIMASAERLGIRDYLQPDHLTTSEAFREVTAAIKSNPQSKLALAEREGLMGVAQRASELIDEIGGTRDLSALSAEVKGGMQAAAKEMEGKANRLWAESRREIGDATKVDAPNARAALNDMVQELGGEAQAKLALPAEARRFLSPMMGDGSPITYGYLDLARKQVGQALQKASGPFANMEQGTLNRFYAALSRDQEIVARAAGDNAFYAYQAAKYATRLQKGVESDLAALFGKELDRSFVSTGSASLPGAFRQLASGDSAPLGRLLAAVPEEMRPRVVASGLTTVFKKAATRGDLDFTGYAKWFENLRSQRQAYAAVMSELPLGARKQLTSLYRVSKGISESLNRRTKTGALNTIRQEMMGGDGLMESIYSIAKRAGAGLAIEPVTTAAGMPGAGIAGAVGSALTRGKSKALTAADDLIASPEFMQLVTAKTPQQQTAAVKRLVVSAAFNKFARRVDGLRDVGAREKMVLEAMRIPQQPQDARNRTIH